MRLLLIILLFTTTLQAQQPLFFALLKQVEGGTAPVEETPFTKPLDVVPDAKVAYGLRKLSSTYSGPLVRIRRASDNAEQDIYPTTAGHFGVAAYNTFLGGVMEGMGFVVKWYDQSGNGIDAVPPSTALQPTIAMNFINGKPALNLYYLESNRWFTITTNLFAGATADLFSATMISGTVNSFGSSFFNINYAGDLNLSNILNNAGDRYSIQGGSWGNAANSADGVWRVYNMSATSTVKTMRFNTTAYTISEAPTLYPSGSQTYRLYSMLYNASFQYEWDIIGHTSEMIIYNSTRNDTQRTDLRNNINDYYNIY